MKEIQQEFYKWLLRNGVRLVVAVRTPQGEFIKPENFIPKGWTVVIGIKENSKEQKNSTVQ